ncbi:hypothetical protein FXO38_10609 [Capsicum annuum]|nr:hypothetical protein FXO38_10609 [Capsicum annuum]
MFDNLRGSTPISGSVKVDESIAIRENNLIPRMVNWKVVKPKPRHEDLMEDMFNKVSHSPVHESEKDILNREGDPPQSHNKHSTDAKSVNIVEDARQSSKVAGNERGANECIKDFEKTLHNIDEDLAKALALYEPPLVAAYLKGIVDSDIAAINTCLGCVWISISVAQRDSTTSRQVQMLSSNSVIDSSITTYILALGSKKSIAEDLEQKGLSSYDEKKEKKQTGPIGFGAILQTILDRVTIIEENVQDLHQSYRVFKRENVKANELDKDIIFANLTTMHISQEEISQEEKPSYDDGLVAKTPRELPNNPNHMRYRDHSPDDRDHIFVVAVTAP